MRCVTAILLTALLSMAGMEPVNAATCTNDFRTRVAANGHCLVIKAYGETAERTALLIFLHGDKNLIADYMKTLAQQFASKGVVAVALIRPGYNDSTGNFSTGQNLLRGGDYGSETEAAAVKALKDHYKADYVVLAGRSGGSAVAAIIIGKYPELVDAVVLGACPCNVGAWRDWRNKEGYILSPSPHEFVGNMAKNAKVFAFTATDDPWVAPFLAKDYVNDLKENGIDATFFEVPGSSHAVEENGSFLAVLVKLLAGRSYGTLEPSKECPYCGNTPKLPESAVGMDIDAKAQRLIKDWGEHAAKIAVKRANEMEATGDSESQAIWLKVRDRIEKMQN